MFFFCSALAPRFRREENHCTRGRRQIMARVIFFVAFFFATVVHADESIKIPLTDIWAYNIPGTTEVSEKEEKPKNATPAEWIRFNRESLVNQISDELASERKLKQPAETGFCVSGEGLDALKAAHAIIVK